MSMIDQFRKLDELIVEHTQPPVQAELRNQLALTREQVEAYQAGSDKQEETLARQLETISKLQIRCEELEARHRGEQLGAVEISILRLAHSSYPKRQTRDEIASTLKMKVIDLDYSMRRLVERGFLRMPVGGLWYEGHPNPDGYSLTDSGIDVLRRENDRQAQERTNK